MPKFFNPIVGRNRLLLLDEGHDVSIHWVSHLGTTIRSAPMICRLSCDEKNCPACDADFELELMGAKPGWGAIRRRQYRVLDLVDTFKDVEPLIWLASERLGTEVDSLASRGIDLYRTGHTIQDTRYRAYRGSLPSWALFLSMQAMVGMMPLPTMDMPGERERMEGLFPPSILRECVNLDEPWANTERYTDRIPFDQGQSTPSRSEPREFCARCGADTTNEWPLWCSSCRKDAS